MRQPGEPPRERGGSNSAPRAELDWVQQVGKPFEERRGVESASIAILERMRQLGEPSKGRVGVEAAQKAEVGRVHKAESTPTLDLEDCVDQASLPESVTKITFWRLNLSGLSCFEFSFAAPVLRDLQAGR